MCVMCDVCVCVIMFTCVRVCASRAGVHLVLQLFGHVLIGTRETHAQILEALGVLQSLPEV